MDKGDEGAFASQGVYVQEGLSKREYYASLAMQSLISNNPTSAIDIAKSALVYADALLVELAKGSKGMNNF